jgi:hypothetical protein
MGSVGFSLTAYDINPGNSSLFPWLSVLAAMFEEYQFLGFVVDYQPSSGTAVSSTSAALGNVIMSTDYDVLNPNFTDMQAMAAYEYSTITLPNKNALHPIECKKSANVLGNLFTRTAGELSTGADQRFYDMGTFQIATEGMQSVYKVGNLWVVYHITFRKPRLPAIPGNFWHGRSTPVDTAAAATFGGTSGFTTSQFSTIQGIGASTAVGTGIKISRVGVYLLVADFQGTANITAAMTLTFGANITYGQNLLIKSTVPAFGANQLTFGEFISTISCNQTGIGTANDVTFGGLTGYTAGNTDVFLFPIPSSSLAARSMVQQLSSSIREGRSILKFLLAQPEMDRFNGGYWPSSVGDAKSAYQPILSAPVDGQHVARAAIRLREAEYKNSSDPPCQAHGEVLSWKNVPVEDLSPDERETVRQMIRAEAREEESWQKVQAEKRR